MPRPRDSLIQTGFTSTPSASYQAADPVTDRDAKAQAPRGGAAHAAPASVSADIHGGAHPDTGSVRGRPASRGLCRVLVRVLARGGGRER